MRLVCIITVLLTAACLPTTVFSQKQALFVKKDIVENGKRVARQTSADQMVQNILQWLQGVYTQNSRKIRQGTLREYLPPLNTQKPRPFESITTATFPTNHIGEGNNNIIGGYPAAGSITPRPAFSDGFQSQQTSITPGIQIPSINAFTTPSQPQPSFFQSTGATGSSGFSVRFPSVTGTTGYPSTGFPRPTNGYPSGPSTAYPASTTGYPAAGTPRPTAGYPATSTGYPSSTTSFPSSSTGYPRPSTPNVFARFPGSSTSQPTTGSSTGYPYPSTPNVFTRFPGSSTSQPTTGSTTVTTAFRSGTPGSPTVSARFPDSSTSQPTTEYTTTATDSTTITPDFLTDFPTSSPRPFPTGTPTTQPFTSDTSATETQSPFTTETTTHSDSTPTPEENTIPSQEPRFGLPGDIDYTTAIAPSSDDLRHPPHIHDIKVECSKEMMTINMEFNRRFDGIIYSKGYYNNPECRYVQENSGDVKYRFTVNLNSCGTQFVNGFNTEGKSYLENVLVLQNEPGIQEVWDTVRAVRCLWEGNLRKVLNVALSVDMLNQEIVTFSGDTAMARLDIQVGKGPFAPSANGLVKIGEVMTLVVSVTGDSGFDIQVKDCKAKDSDGENVVPLTDERGCVLKPKLFGAFQKTKNTGNTGASIIAYAFFNAFKFPDVMDLTLECNVDLCKTDCEVCPEANQRTEPGRRRRRDIYSQNATEDDSVTMGKTLRVILPEDLNDGKSTINIIQSEGICMSTQGFVLSSALLISLLTSSCLYSAYMWLKYQRVTLKK